MADHSPTNALEELIGAAADDEPGAQARLSAALHHVDVWVALPAGRVAHPEQWLREVLRLRNGVAILMARGPSDMLFVPAFTTEERAGETSYRDLALSSVPFKLVAAAALMSTAEAVVINPGTVPMTKVGRMALRVLAQALNSDSLP